ncbi:MAG: tRNA lysidine(34) synthetase TilS [Ignavibacterium sp.]|nr:tRNA lysidine(34) synthetase TilS [Ignavibacterium sp.]MDW8375425.1 tRNA lysidine(34) synthetase TilS [Ignavibacteriales bacterium]
MNLNKINKTIEQKVIKFIKDNCLIENGDKILIALSGGSDSVFLINFLFKYKKKYNIELAAFHLNHLLRDESKSDQDFCENLCKNFGIPFFTKVENVKQFAKQKKLSIEEAGRILRYEALQDISLKYGFNKIATAHNLNDNSETVLLNLIKGKGISSISGIPIKYNNIIRPIICLSKTEIETYLKVNKIKFIKDLSNYCEDYERNYLRNRIVPLIENKLNNNFNYTIYQSSKILREYLNFTEKIINETYDKFVNVFENRIEIDLINFYKEEFFIKSEIIRKIFINELKLEPTFKNINSVLNLLNNQKGKIIRLKNNFKVIKENDRLVIIKFENKRYLSYKVEPGKSLSINNFEISIKKVNNVLFDKNKFIEYVDADKITGEIKIRNWQKGDKFVPLGCNGMKKISDFLTDSKVPSSKKDEILVMQDSEKIFYVVGLRIDDRVKITESSKNIYKIELTNA